MILSELPSSIREPISIEPNLVADKKPNTIHGFQVESGEFMTNSAINAAISPGDGQSHDFAEVSNNRIKPTDESTLLNNRFSPNSSEQNLTTQLEILIRQEKKQSTIKLVDHNLFSAANI